METNERPELPKGKFQFLRPRSGFEFFLLILMSGLLLSWGFKQFATSRQPNGERKKSFVPPEKIDYDLVRIHRAAEDAMAEQMLQRWQARERKVSVAAVYEFSVMPYKPVFFFGAAKGGGLDRHKILEEELRIFEGTMAAGDKIAEVTHEGLSFLCAPFQRGSGLVALSAVCVWDDGDSAGFGLRIAGGDVEDTLRYTAEARKSLKNPAPPPPFPFVEDRPRVSPKNESEINRVMRDIVATLLSYNCDRFTGFLPPGSKEMFRSRVDKEVLNSIKDPVEKVCFVLSIIKFPRSETMLIRQRGEITDRAVLDLLSREELSPIAEFALVKTSDGWKIDPDWALKQVQDYPVKMSLLRFAMDKQVQTPYSDEPKSKNSDRGIANPNSGTGKIYASLSSEGKSICGSVLSESGELFLIHLDSNKNVSYTRGSSLPSNCPVTSLGPNW